MAEKYYNILLGARPQLVELQNLIRRKAPDGTEYTDPATFHVTLVYIEDDKGLPDLDFTDLAADLPIFGMTGDFVEPYGDGEEKTAVGLQINRSPQLSYLQAAVYYRAQAAGMKIGQYSYPQRFRPHITMAMVSSGDGMRGGISVYLQNPTVVEVSSFALTAEDSYEPVASWNLRTDIPIQEFIEQHASNVDTRSELNVREQTITSGERTEIEMTIISEMKGGYPTIKLPSDIDVEALKKQGREFVTLPIGQVDAKSRNDRRYTRTAMEQMVAQINDKRPEGGWGHIPDEQMGTAYGPPAIRWLAAAIDRNGVAWGKGLPLTSESAQYFKDARLTNARVGTSLHAYVGMEGQDVQSMELIRLDLADPARVGVPMTAAPAELSTEMTDSTPSKPEAAPSTTSQDIIQESASVADNDIKRVTELEQERRLLSEQIAGLEKTIKEQGRKLEDAADVYRIIGFKADGDVVRQAREFHEQHDDMVTENTSLLQEAMSSMIKEQVKVESARPLVAELVKSVRPVTKAQLTRTLEEVLARESIRALLAVKVVEEMGEAQPAKPTDKDKPNPINTFLEPEPAEAVK